MLSINVNKKAKNITIQTMKIKIFCLHQIKIPTSFSYDTFAFHQSGFKLSYETIELRRWVTIFLPRMNITSEVI